LSFIAESQRLAPQQLGFVIVIHSSRQLRIASGNDLLVAVSIDELRAVS